MTAPLNDGLAKVTIATPTRRVDVALPEGVPVIELMVTLLRSVGDGAGDEAQRLGGWVLRTADGEPIEFDKTLAEQSVRDGQILHLVGRQKEWPPLDYDDVVDAIATGARTQTRSWSSPTTRQVGTVIGAVAFVGAFASLLTSGPHWQSPSIVALAIAVVLLGMTYAFSRAFGDQSGAQLSGVGAMAFGWLGGLLLFADDKSLSALEPSHWLTSGALLIVFSVVGIVVAGHRVEFLVAGALSGLVTVIAASFALADSINGVSAAAIALAFVMVCTPAWPLASMRLGKLPVPPLPRTADELLADPPQPALAEVHGAVRRSDEILTGLLAGTALCAVLAQVVLVVGSGISGVIFVAVASISSLLRARLFPTVRHRTPLLVAGMAGLATIAFGWALTSPPTTIAYAVVPALVVFALLVIAVSRYFSTHVPSPFLGRIADIFDVLLALGIVPLMCLVVGLFGYLRGLYG